MNHPLNQAYVYKPCEQGSDVWHSLRAGACTASRFSIARQRMKRAAGGRDVGAPTAACEQYAWLLALERIAGKALSDPFETYAMRRGREEEQPGRELYECRTGMVIQAQGLALSLDGRFGYSTDGKVYDHPGLVEIKAPMAPEKVGGVWVNPKPFLDEHIDQCDGGLMITGHDWIDLVVYTPWLAAVGKDLFVHRFLRNDDRIKALRSDLEEFWDLTSHYERALRAGSAEPAPTPPAAAAPAPAPIINIPSTAPGALPETLF